MTYPFVVKLFFGISLLFLSSITTSASEINLAVANSTCKATKKVGALFSQQRNVQISYFCKSSGRLAKGLNGGSIAADIYISANRKWMDFMLDKKLVATEQVSSTWGNQLVVATRADNDLKFSQWNDLNTDVITTILIGDPSTAPFGRYTKEALQSTGLWKSVRNKIQTKKHITLLADILAVSDSRTVGILFLSNLTDKHRVLYSIDKSWHSPIRYYMAPVNMASDKKSVMEFIDFIQGPEAQEIFRKEGFLIKNSQAE